MDPRECASHLFPSDPPSLSLIWAAIWEKKRCTASAEAMARFKVRASANFAMSCGEYCKRIRSDAHCALNNSIAAEAKSAVSLCLSTSLGTSDIMHCSSISCFTGGLMPYCADGPRGTVCGRTASARSRRSPPARSSVVVQWNKYTALMKRCASNRKQKQLLKFRFVCTILRRPFVS